MFFFSKVLSQKIASPKPLFLTTLIFKRNMSTQDNKADILKWASKDGEFRRQQSVFRDFIEDDVNAKFAAEP
jgi:putative glutathione S-transferase